MRTMMIGLAALTAVTALGVSSARAQSLSWEPCEADPAAQCATLSVPVDWKDPGGPRFDLHLARRQASGDRVGSMVFGPGGPGDSGVERITTGMHRFSDDLKERFDIVSFDPRGIGASNPVTCSADLLAQQPSPVVTSRKDFDALRAYNRDLRADCRERTGPVYDHLDSVNQAHDLDAIRAALGEDRLTFHGSSYGTLLGQMYAEQYPHRIRAMVLESVVDHSLGTRDFIDSQAATAQDSFDHFVAWCNSTSDCALHGRDVKAVWAELMSRAERGVLADPDHPGITISPFLLSLEAMKRFYGPDNTELATRLAALHATPPAPGTPMTPPPTTSYPFAVFCQDWNLPIHSYREYAAHQNRIAKIAPEMKYPRALMALSSCVGSPPAQNPQHRVRIRTDRPLLLTNSLHDPAAGYDWATNVKRQIGREAVLLTYEGAGHGTYSSSPCAQALIDRYLVDGTPPPPGTRCPAA